MVGYVQNILSALYVYLKEIWALSSADFSGNFILTLFDVFCNDQNILQDTFICIFWFTTISMHKHHFLTKRVNVIRYHL